MMSGLTILSNLMAAEVSYLEEPMASQTSLHQQRKKCPKIESRANSARSRARRWKTEEEQRIYSSKLLLALRQFRRDSSTKVRSSVAGRQVRETADRLLAVADKGKSRWSRAILSRQLLVKFNKSRQVTRRLRSRRLEKKRLPMVQRKIKLLGQLIPGGRKLSLATLLEETTDYIAALKMQVRAMTAMTEPLTGSTTTSHFS